MSELIKTGGGDKMLQRLNCVETSMQDIDAVFDELIEAYQYCCNSSSSSSSSSGLSSSSSSGAGTPFSAMRNMNPFAFIWKDNMTAFSDIEGTTPAGVDRVSNLQNEGTGVDFLRKSADSEHGALIVDGSLHIDSENARLWSENDTGINGESSERIVLALFNFDTHGYAIEVGDIESGLSNLEYYAAYASGGFSIYGSLGGASQLGVAPTGDDWDLVAMVDNGINTAIYINGLLIGTVGRTDLQLSHVFLGGISTTSPAPCDVVLAGVFVGDNRNDFNEVHGYFLDLKDELNGA